MRQFSGVDATFLHKENARTTNHVSGVVVLDPSTVTDTAPASVYATLLDQGTYLCSESTMYRILRAAVRPVTGVGTPPIRRR